MNKKVLLVIFFLVLTACGQQTQNLATVDTTNIVQLDNVEAPPLIAPSSSDQVTLSSMRIKLLQDTSLSIGAQGGLAWASEKMNSRLTDDRKYLDSIFNFYALVLDHGVIPPILAEGDKTLNLADPNTIRVSDKLYKIIQQARFGTTPPNWREYLWLTYSKPELPDKTLLPRNYAERKIWQKGIHLGWDMGIQQAYSIFQQNLARLKRDYKGMILYRKLLQARMISPPFVARTELGVTGNGDDMRINDQVLRIVELPKLQTNTKHWKAIVVKKDE